MAGYIGKKAALTVGIAATVDELNYNDTGSAVGTVVASKTVTADANKDVASFRNITLTGELDAGSLDISGNADIDGTLETDALSIDGTTVTTTAAEINLIDGGTARGTTAIADGDGLLVNDAGTMRMTTVQTVKTYMTAGVGGGGTEFIASSGAISNAADVEFDQFDSSKYDSYIFKFYYLIPATDSVWPIGQVSSNGGTSYDTTNGNYHYGGDTDFNGYYLSPVYNMGSAANEYGMCGEMELFAPHLSIYTYASVFTIMTSTSAGIVSSINGGHREAQVHLSAAAQNAIKFSFSSGNIESGEIVMFGIKNS